MPRSEDPALTESFNLTDKEKLTNLRAGPSPNYRELNSEKRSRQRFCVTYSAEQRQNFASFSGVVYAYAHSAHITTFFDLLGLLGSFGVNGLLLGGDGLCAPP